MSAIVDHRIGAGQAEQRRLAGAERHRVVERHPVHDVEILHGLGDRRQPEGHRQPRGHQVARMDQRVAQRRLADIAAFVIDRLPGRLTGALRDRDRRVLDDAPRVEAVFQRGDIDERLERRARLPFGLGGAVELALLERPAADQRKDAAVFRVHHHDAAADIRQLPQRVLPGAGRRATLPACRGGERLDQDDVARLQHVRGAPHSGTEPLIVQGAARPAQLVERNMPRSLALAAFLQDDLRGAGLDGGDRRQLPAADPARLGDAGQRGLRRGCGREMLQRAAPAMPAVIFDQPIAEGRIGHLLRRGCRLVGGLRLLFHIRRLGVHRLDAGLSAGINVLDVLAVLRRHVIQFVGLVDQRRGLLLHVVLAGAAHSGCQADCEENH